MPVERLTTAYLKARSTRMPFGQYEGMTFEHMAKGTKSGMLYLDYLRREHWTPLWLKAQITIYFGNENNARLLQRKVAEAYLG